MGEEQHASVPLIEIDHRQILGGCGGRSGTVAAGSKASGLKRAATGPVIAVDASKILGGAPDGSTKVAAGSKAVGLKPQA